MKTVLITGASGGIGEAFARKLAARKFNLFLIARSNDKLAKICEELTVQHSIQADFLAIDLTTQNVDSIVFDETQKRSLQIDWLINNAGFGTFGDFAELDLRRELEMIDLNVKTLVALTHRFLSQMRERKNGIIINVSSTAGFQPLPYLANYAATKSFVTSFSEALHEENRHFGVKIMALCPGGTATNFFERAGIGEKLPMRSLQTPEKVVETALKAIERGKSRIVSGWTNSVVANLETFVPNRLIARIVANTMRSRANSNKSSK